MLDCQISAIEKVREYARRNETAYCAYMEQVCNPLNINPDVLIEWVLRNPVTLNFHPDRILRNGKTIMENLLAQGEYHGQFRTGTTNGGKTAYIGGDRYLWEQRLFFDAYPQESLDRPKYGALNLFRYADGASARFGSCFFTLKHDIVSRCTFAYGDSSLTPTILCTSDTFAGILVGLLVDVKNHRRLLNKVVSSQQEALAILANPRDEHQEIGKNLDDCIEAHIHGDVRLSEDVENLSMDGSYLHTPFAEQAKLLCEKYGITLKTIPKRQVHADDISALFRGPTLPLLAKKMSRCFVDAQGIIDAALIGKASRESMLHPEKWTDIGTESELFQYFKQLWHIVGYFG